MKFTAQPVVSNVPNCNMRIGKLSDISRFPNAVFITPLLLLYSKGASVAHLTREVLDMVTNISSHIMQIPLANSFQCYNGVKNFKQGITSFAGLSECLSYCTVQDPAEETKVGYNDRNSITVWTGTGRKQLTPDKYMDMIEAFQPDMYHVLCDGDTNRSTSHKRAKKALDVSTKMFLTCVERHNKSEKLKDSALIAVLEGGYDLKPRREAAQMLSRHSQVHGFVIDGLHNNGASVEQMTYDAIEPIITETLKWLPDDKLRIVHGSWRPDVVLDLVQAGIDVFDSSLVYTVTDRGCALSFTYKILENSECSSAPKTNGLVNRHHVNENEIIEQQSEKNDVKSSLKNLTDYEINLNDKVYFDDLSPIMNNCQCLTCRKHTRAYIHHLLNSHEMLASVLLMIHNLHHYEQFFHTIRESGKSGHLLTIDSPLS